MKKYIITFVLAASSLITKYNAQSFTESFDNIASLSSKGWVMINKSNPIGTTGWFQGDSSQFTANDGISSSYIAASFNNIAGGPSTISNWLIMPTTILRNGDQLTFYTRTVSNSSYADRLQVRMSTSGYSTNVGDTADNVGEFTTLLLDINPTLTTTDYPSIWTAYTVTISGLSSTTSGRLAFRYFVSDAGPYGDNSDYIGIDSVTFQNIGVNSPTLKQKFNIGETLSTLKVNGQNIKWYASAEDANTHQNVLSSTTALVDGTIYFATQTVNGCESRTASAVKAVQNQ